MLEKEFGPMTRIVLSIDIRQTLINTSYYFLWNSSLPLEPVSVLFYKAF